MGNLGSCEYPIITAPTDLAKAQIKFCNRPAYSQVVRKRRGKPEVRRVCPDHLVQSLHEGWGVL